MQLKTLTKTLLATTFLAGAVLTSTSAFANTDWCRAYESDEFKCSTHSVFMHDKTKGYYGVAIDNLSLDDDRDYTFKVVIRDKTSRAVVHKDTFVLNRDDSIGEGSFTSSNGADYIAKVYIKGDYSRNVLAAETTSSDYFSLMLSNDTEMPD